MSDNNENHNFLLTSYIQAMEERLSKYREQNTRAIKNYRQKSRTKINATAKKYYDTHKENPEWLAHKRERQRIYQKKRRELKKLKLSLLQNTNMN